MNLYRNVLLACGLAMGGIFGIAPEAHAGNYASVSIENPTGGTLHYQLQWGPSGRWESHSVPAGMAWTHFYPLDEDDRAPTPGIRFDYILNDGEVTYRTYALGFYAVCDRVAGNGKPYVFRISRCGCYLDLYAH